MPIKNYTTQIDLFQSLGEIQSSLARHGASKIMVDYSGGKPTGITFAINTDRGPVGFRLPANTAGVAQVMRAQKVKENPEQVERTACEISEIGCLRRWRLSRPATCRSMRCFLPYIMDKSGRTLYQAYLSGQLCLGDGS